MSLSGFIVALVGRPNAGKSALFNRLVGRAASIVHETAGVTRDRLYGTCSWSGEEFTLLDTGGFDLASENELVKAIREQVERAIEEADALVFVVDAKSGLMPEDAEVAEILRKTKKPVIVAANKCDVPSHQARAYEFYQLGFSEVFPVSGLHGLGTGELLDRLVELKRSAGHVEEPQKPVADEAIRVAIVGKPNVGKSSLANALIGTERMTTSPIPGTTVDAVDIPFTVGNDSFVLVDTAGLRRPARIEEAVEDLAVGKALSAVKRSDVSILVLDGSQVPSSQDRRIAGYIRRNGKASVIVVNKTDKGFFRDFNRDTMKSVVLGECYPISYSKVLFTSCATREGIGLVLPAVKEAFLQYSRRLATAELNKVLEFATEMRRPPGRGKVYYGVQVGERPPQMVLFVNDPSRFDDMYMRYLEGEIRRYFGFEGSPIVFELRARRKSKEES